MINEEHYNLMLQIDCHNKVVIIFLVCPPTTPRLLSLSRVQHDKSGFGDTLLYL